MLFVELRELEERGGLLDLAEELLEQLDVRRSLLEDEDRLSADVVRLQSSLLSDEGVVSLGGFLEPRLLLAGSVLLVRFQEEGRLVLSRGQEV